MKSNVWSVGPVSDFAVALHCLQAMLNRIAYLQSEEAKIDRDIDKARKRTEELLGRKAEKAKKVKDEDVLKAASDVLQALASTEPSAIVTRRTSRPSSVTGVCMRLLAN
jgi:uncharacterized protein YydD (DUF2326 family)